VAGDEVGMHVGEQHQLDGQALGLGVGQVLRDVAARVDDRRPARDRVGDQVRRLREAGEVVLVEDHAWASVP
jgi:hypothetical protein